MSTEHKCTHIHIRGDMHASVYTCIYVYIVYVDESECKLLYLGILYLIFNEKENH